MLLVGVSLSMDAFAVSVVTGIGIGDLKLRYALKTGLFFGFFQFLMPVLGFLAGSAVSRYIEKYDHWVVFGLLALIGGKMILDTVKGGGEEAADFTNTVRLLVLSVATSIDALAVGVSFALMEVNILLASGIVGFVTFAICVFGVMAGKRLGDKFRKKAMIFGGVVLCLIGVKILVEHLAG
jgi:putative Mn2+ efflux pump MntP